ncbi:putative gp55 [Mycobacteroides abscessus]|nr:putative gp55 [Mycobacteroides abscessus]
MYRGMLALPYLRKSYEFGWGVASIRFRCIEEHEHHGHGKYMTVAGDRPRLYNTLSLWKGAEKVAITEGELDAIAAESCGIRAVGVPGATSWQRYFREPFLGYQTVYILADGMRPVCSSPTPWRRTYRTHGSCRCQKARTLTTSFSEKDEKH